MIFLTDNIRKENRIEFIVYDSLEDLSKRVDWQDILDPSLIILDEDGNIYTWDDKKIEEIGIVFNYSFKAVRTDLDLAKRCKAKFFEMGRPYSFELGTESSV
jgi:hypothetical protein